MSRKNLADNLVKKVEIYYDDLHKFLLAESRGYKELNDEKFFKANQAPAVDDAK